MTSNNYQVLKRVFDIVFALIGCLAVSVFALFITIIIKIDSKGPVLFKQERVGKNWKLFKIYKFRTMYVNENNRHPQVLNGESPQITKVGKFLRKFKLDELPQLINVLKGEMSFVGPRPEIPKYVNNYKKQYHKILKIKPGITDYASLKYIKEGELLNNIKNPEVKYINEIHPAKLYYNLKYIEEQNFRIDLSIIFKTLCSIIK
jgi:lipopolysaccharide/colanic/teichoic acid biosynthesis glycosyltransferase